MKHASGFSFGFELPTFMLSRMSDLDASFVANTLSGSLDM